jgi:hypothetical protein
MAFDCTVSAIPCRARSSWYSCRTANRMNFEMGMCRLNLRPPIPNAGSKYDRHRSSLCRTLPSDWSASARTTAIQNPPARTLPSPRNGSHPASRQRSPGHSTPETVSKCSTISARPDWDGPVARPKRDGEYASSRRSCPAMSNCNSSAGILPLLPSAAQLARFNWAPHRSEAHAVANRKMTADIAFDECATR